MKERKGNKISEYDLNRFNLPYTTLLKKIT